MGNASNVCGGEQPTSALALFEALCALDGASAGSWLDCATRLEIAASEAVLAGQSSPAMIAGQSAQACKLRDRADLCRANAIRASRQAVP